MLSMQIVGTCDTCRGPVIAHIVKTHTGYMHVTMACNDCHRRVIGQVDFGPVLQTVEKAQPPQGIR